MMKHEKYEVEDYTTKKGKKLYIRHDAYDRYNSTTRTHILEGIDGIFYGYSDDPNIKR